MNFDRQPTLETDLVLLRPLAESDFEPLREVASDPQIWEQHPAKSRATREGFEQFFRESLESGGALAVVERASGEVIGSSRFQPVPGFENEAVEIGWSFLARRFWGGEFNRSMKTAMLRHAFRFVDSVLFYVNDQNLRSQRAMEKIGGVRVSSLNGRVLPAKPLSPVIFLISKTQFSMENQESQAQNAAENQAETPAENLSPEELAAIFPPLPEYLRTTEAASASLRKMGFWALIIAFCSVAASLLTLVEAYSDSGTGVRIFEQAYFSATPLSALGLLGLGIGFLAQWFNFQFSQKVKIALEDSDSVRLAAAFRHQRDYFLWTLIGLVFSVGVLISQILS